MRAPEYWENMKQIYQALIVYFLSIKITSTFLFLIILGQTQTHIFQNNHDASIQSRCLQSPFVTDYTVWLMTKKVTPTHWSKFLSLWWFQINKGCHVQLCTWLEPNYSHDERRKIFILYLKIKTFNWQEKKNTEQGRCLTLTAGPNMSQLISMNSKDRIRVTLCLSILSQTGSIELNSGHCGQVRALVWLVICVRYCTFINLRVIDSFQGSVLIRDKPCKCWW